METWKPVVGYEGIYEVSNIGNIKNSKTNKILKQPKRSGYPSVGMAKNKIAKNHRIHRLVAMAFIENPENKRCVNHKDGNKLNNNVENLEWCTHSENNYHAMKNGLNHSRKGHEQKFSKLTNEMVIEIIEKLKTNFPTEICKQYNVSSRTIYDIKLGNTWSWLTGVYRNERKRNSSNSALS